MSDLEITTKPFVSQAQAGWAFATGQPWARRWARETGPYKRLPKRKRKTYTVKDLEKAVEQGAAQSLVDAIAAQCVELPRLKGEQIAPGITRIRGNLCNVHGRYGKCPGAPAAPPKVAKPKKGRARKPAKGPKGKDPAAIARQQQRDRERAEDREHTLARREEVARDRDLRLRRQEMRERERLAKLNAAKPEKAPKGGGGGGKGKPEKPEKPAKQTDTRAQIVRDAAQRARAAEQGLERRRREDAQRQRQQAAVERSRVTTPALASAAQQLSEGQELSQSTADALVRNGLARRDRNGKLTLTATGLRATRQKAARGDRNPLSHSPNRTETTPVGAKARQSDAAGSSVPQSTFAVFKDATGRDRWLSVTTTAYQDRDREWISRKAIVGAVAAGDATKERGPLRFWHVPGLDLGTCDYQATAQDGRFLIESGTFKSAVAARIGQAAADRHYQMSPGFVHPADEPRNGVFDHITIFERSIVPAGRASNPFTRLMVKGVRMLTDEKKKEFEALAGDAESRAFLSDLLSTVQTTDKAAQETATYKDAPDWAQALIGRIEALEAREKAAPPMAAEEPPVEVEEKVDGEMMMEEEPTGGLTLSPEDLAAIAEALTPAFQAALAPLAGLLDIEKKMSAHVQNVMGGYQTQKDAQDAERQQQIDTLQQTLKATQDKLAELLGETPAAYKGHRITDNPIVGEARKEQLIPTPPTAADFDPIVAQLAGNGVKLPGT